ncbi:MAG: amylosucrase, partial [Clostridia bacterium]|nr:amylosucrase [Clostridia bacterium]
LSGLPIIYSGDEIGQENDYSYHDDPLKSDDSRYIHRGRLNWDAAALTDKKGTVENRLFTAIRELEKLRAAHRVFSADADTWLIETGNQSVLGIGRYFDGEKLCALFSFSEREQVLPLNELGEYKDLMTGESVNKHSVTIPAGGFAWLACEFGEV